MVSKTGFIVTVPFVKKGSFISHLATPGKQKGHRFKVKGGKLTCLNPPTQGRGRLPFVHEFNEPVLSRTLSSSATLIVNPGQGIRVEVSAPQRATLRSGLDESRTYRVRGIWCRV